MSCSSSCFMTVADTDCDSYPFLTTIRRGHIRVYLESISYAVPSGNTSIDDVIKFLNPWQFSTREKGETTSILITVAPSVKIASLGCAL